MPSLPHELPLALFRECPELALHLLSKVLGVKLPSYGEVRVEASDFTQVVPTEVRADLVLVLYQDGVPVMGIVVEVQRRIDLRKRFTWPLYVAELRARIERDVILLVVTDDEQVACWAGDPIVTGPGSVQRVEVLGPQAVPWVRTMEEAVRLPELAVLSVLAHGNDPAGLEVVLSTLDALVTLDAERKKFYYDVVLVALNEATRRALERELMMEPGKYEYRSEFARTYLAQGRAEGEARGEVKGRAAALLAVLEARGMDVDAETREHILGCADPQQLERWIVRAATVSSLHEVLTST
jgi:uncharacterized ferritin-like protein (DUF455 family)